MRTHFGIFDFASASLLDAQEANSSVKHRNVGFTIETKPDYCRKAHIDSMLTYGATRIEIGVQSLQQDVLKRSNRGHGFDEIVESFQEAKDAGYKIAAHMMPGLPGATIKHDLADFESLYSDARLGSRHVERFIPLWYCMERHCTRSTWQADTSHMMRRI